MLNTNCTQLDLQIKSHGFHSGLDSTFDTFIFDEAAEERVSISTNFKLASPYGTQVQTFIACLR